jgi:hypothetical protein
MGLYDRGVLLVVDQLFAFTDGKKRAAKSVGPFVNAKRKPVSMPVKHAQFYQQ